MTDLRLVRTGRRADLVLNRPDKRNALTMAMWTAIPALLAEAAADPGLRLLVIRGEGGTFCAGADIAEFPQTFADTATALRSQTAMTAATAAIEAFPAPTVAVIRGACVGGGCSIALACDLRIAAQDARLGITPAKLGLVYGVADSRRLVAAVGLSRTKDLLFTGRLVGGEDAARIGLIDRLATDPDAEAAALEQDLIAASGFSARAQKQMLHRLRDGAADDDPAGAALFASALDHADFHEGFAAFQEKRPPRFP